MSETVQHVGVITHCLYQFKEIRHTAFREMCILFGMLSAFSPFYSACCQFQPDSIHLNGRFKYCMITCFINGALSPFGRRTCRMIFIGKCQPLKSVKWSSRKHTGAWFPGNFTWRVYSRYLRNSHTQTCILLFLLFFCMGKHTRPPSLSTSKLQNPILITPTTS